MPGLLLLSAGCASVIVAGVGGGVAYTVTNVAYKTVTYPFFTVEAAAHKALKKMGITETGKTTLTNGLRITAETSRIAIHVDLESITSLTTNISVDARKNIVVKDKATATEIIEQTVKILDSGSGPEPVQAKALSL